MKREWCYRLYGSGRMEHYSVRVYVSIVQSVSSVKTSLSLVMAPW